MSFEFFLENVTDPTGRLSAVDFYEIDRKSTRLNSSHT